jgi:putative ATPase
VYVLRPLAVEDLMGLLEAALKDAERGLGALELRPEAAALDLIARAADGDARRALNMLELAAGLLDAAGSRALTAAVAQEVASGGQRRFDKGGDQFYEQISALHKAVRGSDPDAALYWLCRMLDGGCDPRYIARRVARMAVEDIGLADPRALALALDGWETYERLGTPEGELGVATAVVYLACAPKSNAMYVAMSEAMADVAEFGSLEVPLKLRNAPTRLMKNLGYGRDYRYAHDESDAFAAGERYLPDELPDRRYYRPVPRGLEAKIGEALERLRARSPSKG